MAPFRYLTSSIIVSFGLLVAPHPAAAITAEDVMVKMSNDHRAGYLSGLIDMLAYQTAAGGNKEKGNCIIDAFFDEKRKEDSWSKLRGIFQQYSDKRPEVLLTALAGQICKN